MSNEGSLVSVTHLYKNNLLKLLEKLLPVRPRKTTRRKKLELQLQSFCVTRKYNKCKTNSLYIKTVLLEKIDRKVYLKPPEKLGTKKLWKLTKSIYGLCNTPHVCYLSLKTVLKKWYYAW